MHLKSRRFSIPQEVIAMIAHTFQEALDAQWIKTHLSNPTHDLIILRRLLPWQAIIDRLIPFYHPSKGRHGKSLRIMVAISMLARLRQLSDAKVIQTIKENRYMQYFCNIPDRGLNTFMDPSTLSQFRSRLDQQGVAIIEEELFKSLRATGAIDPEMMLQDSTVLESPIVYPTDIALVHNAFDKMASLAERAGLELWWDSDHIKQLWRASRLDAGKPLAYLCAFYLQFEPALETFATHLDEQPKGDVKTRWQDLLEALLILDEQTQLKLEGQRHIPNRLVSLDDLDARPIQKGKRHPKTEFGTPLQLSFNRQGFMITAENFIGQPNDKTLYETTLELFHQRLVVYPRIAITDLGYRSAKNLKLQRDHINHLFMGRSNDVEQPQQEACRKARSATEGMIAVAKHRRGFKRSLYRSLKGARIWTLLHQCAYNLLKFLQLYREEKLPEETLLKLGL
jgi:transposase, IS5 family